jgi:hypothetical protein
MSPSQQTHHHYLTRKLSTVPPLATLPRKIAPGVFFTNSGGNSSKDKDDLPSTKTLINLDITHAVLERGSDLQLSCGVKALFVGPHDPLSQVVAWMRAVRRLGAHIIVGDVAAAAGYLVVELGLNPRAAWLRIARGIPPTGDLLLARLYALALVRHEERVDNGPHYISKYVFGGEFAAGRYDTRESTPDPCQSRRQCRTRTESGLKNVFVLSI